MKSDYGANDDNEAESKKVSSKSLKIPHQNGLEEVFIHP